MSQIVREGFAQFCKRQKAGLLLIGEIQKQEKVPGGTPYRT